MANSNASQDIVPPVSLHFVDMDVWVKEQEAKEALEATSQKENVKPTPALLAAKKIKPLVDVEAFAQEQLAIEELGGDNWIGKLQQYRDVHPVVGGGITWVESEPSGQINPRFTCTVLISESAEHFGNNTIGFSTKVVSFSNKKLAKKYAAKKAIDWLIENNHMPADGSVKFPKPAPTPPEPKVKSIPTTPTPKDDGPQPTSFTAQIPEICRRLGFNPPRYDITPALPNTPLWNGYADFGSDPRIEGKVGEVKNVFGKKNAKEEVAKIVLLFMKDIERQKMAEFETEIEVEDEDKKRKREPTSSPEVPTKVIKVQS